MLSNLELPFWPLLGIGAIDYEREYVLRCCIQERLPTSQGVNREVQLRMESRPSFNAARSTPPDFGHHQIREITLLEQDCEQSMEA